MVQWFKPASKFGKFLKKNGFSQQDIVQGTKISSGTISRLASNDGFKPNLSNAQKIIKFLNRQGHDVEIGDFWNIGE